MGDQLVPLRIDGIDPGMSSGGAVALACSGRDERLVAAFSLVENKREQREATAAARALVERLGWGDPEFTTAYLRARAWIEKLARWLDETTEAHGAADYYAVESFTDQHSRARKDKAGLLRKRWQTPFVIGMLLDELARRGATPENGRVVFQNAGVVLPQHAGELALLIDPARRDGAVVDGDSLITNDHQRKALVHALALSLRLSTSDLNNTTRTETIHA